jgi:hypothetical protein
MHWLVKKLLRMFGTKIKFVFDAHSAQAFVYGELVQTELLFDIDAAIGDPGRFKSRFIAECKRLFALHMRGALAKPLLILELKGELAQRKDFQNLLIEMLANSELFREVGFKIDGKFFAIFGKVLKEVPSYVELKDG